MATEQLSPPNLDLVLTSLTGEARTLREWLTMFHMATVVLDPYTNESAWILKTAARIMHQFSGAAVRINWLMTCSSQEARAFLGPYADEFLVFIDPDRIAVKALGLSELPAFVLVQSNGAISASAQGWSAESWRHVSHSIAPLTNWSTPTIPAPGDPGTFRGTAALV